MVGATEIAPVTPFMSTYMALRLLNLSQESLGS